MRKCGILKFGTIFSTGLDQRDVYMDYAGISVNDARGCVNEVEFEIACKSKRVRERAIERISNSVERNLNISAYKWEKNLLHALDNYILQNSV